MRLSKLYSNRPDEFGPVIFNTGLSVVLAEIRLPENLKEDTHNLGKSLLGSMIDFGLLLGRDASFFLFKHEDLFEDYVFYLEIELFDGSYLTIRRNVKEATRICFKKHKASDQNYSELPIDKWDHSDIRFDKAKEILDSLLDLRALGGWNYRKAMGYLLRTQDDYRDVFQIGNYTAKHATWKPYLAHVLGFDSKLINEYYEKEGELSAKKAVETTIKNELGGTVADLSKVEGIILIKQKEADKKQELLDSFDFRSEDKAKTKQLVNDIDESIATLNEERYYLTNAKKKIATSLQDHQIIFDPEDARKLFLESGVLFAGQIKKDFEQLIAFNRAITEERRKYLEEEHDEIDTKLKAVGVSLNSLGKKRSESLAYLGNTDVYAKHKTYTEEMIALRADIIALEKQRVFLQKLQELRKEIRTLGEQYDALQVKIETNVEKQNTDTKSLFSQIRLYFNEVVDAVIDRKALLSVSPNGEGHLDFKAQILDSAGNPTSADDGHTYRKLLCIALDFAVLRAHLDVKYPRFVFHDGAFESLDDRKKKNLLDVFREYANLGLQPIVTLIDSDLPLRTDEEDEVFEEDEIVLLLHDEGKDGRLFRMDSW